MNPTGNWEIQTAWSPEASCGPVPNGVIEARRPPPPATHGIFMTIEHFQNLIIGCCVAGKILAWTLAKQGQKTVVVERSMIGGSCVNVACLPSKNVIYSAKAVSLVHPTTDLGVVTGSMLVDMAGVARHKRQMVDG